MLKKTEKNIDLGSKGKGVYFHYEISVRKQLYIFHKSHGYSKFISVHYTTKNSMVSNVSCLYDFGSLIPNLYFLG